MAVQVVNLAGEEYVLIPKKEFEDLQRDSLLRHGSPSVSAASENAFTRLAGSDMIDEAAFHALRKASQM